MHPTRIELAAARSGSLHAGLALALVAEALAIHLWLAERHPWLAWASTALTILTLLWLAADYRALGDAHLVVDDEIVAIAVGRRWRGSIPRRSIVDVQRLTWRTVPEPAPDYRNLTKPAEPTLLVTLAEPVTLRGPGGVRLRARRLGVHVEAPDEALALLAPR